MEKNIFVDIEISPIYNLKEITNELIFSKLKDKYLQKCTKQYGFITNIILNDVYKKYISIYNGNIIIKCNITITSILPKIDDIFTGTIKKIYTQGMIIIVKNCIRVFVPNWNDKSLKVSDTVKIKCTQVRFKKSLWDCIGTIVQ